MTSQGLMGAGAFVFVVAMVLGMAQPERIALDGPFERAEIVKTEYLVSGGSLPALERALLHKGPSGGWGRAIPRWEYDAACNVSLRVKVTMPKLSGRWRLTAKELATWDAMIDVLWQHELNHVEIARKAAADIKAAGCDPAETADIRRRHDRAQSSYDRETRNGQTEGVTLRPNG